MALLVSYMFSTVAFATEGEQPSDQPVPEEMPSQEPENDAYMVSLDPQTISDYLEYTTVSPEFAGVSEPYYPGDLTIELTGQIIIEDGGSLTIGTLSVGSDKEARPMIRGILQEDGLIVVKSGGNLTLTTVTFDFSGEGLMIVQEPGGSITLTDTPLDDSWIQWAPPMVDNAYHQPSDLWLEEGTVLTEALLPVTLKTYLQNQGVQEWTDISLQWDLDNYDGRSSGELILTGAFLDEHGAELVSSRPLELVIHWYRPEQIVVTDAVWMGETAASAKLQVEQLPDMASEIWGEVSLDGGETWKRWDDFHIRESEETTTCAFYLSDDTPRHFRICASFISRFYRQYWVSDSFLLPEEGGDDSGGNRGGSTTPVVPDREPQEPEPELTPDPEPEPEPTPRPKPSRPKPTPKPTPEPELEEPIPELEPEPEPTPEPEQEEPEPEPTPEPEPEPEPEVEEPEPEPEEPEPEPIPEPEPEEPEPEPTPEPSLDQVEEDNGLTVPLQVALAVAGLGLCVVTGIAVAHKGIFRNKKL